MRSVKSSIASGRLGKFATIQKFSFGSFADCAESAVFASTYHPRNFQLDSRRLPKTAPTATPEFPIAAPEVIEAGQLRGTVGGRSSVPRNSHPNALNRVFHTSFLRYLQPKVLSDPDNDGWIKWDSTCINC
jgi:hypothetical protein